jgi:hypothetical protein
VRRVTLSVSGVLLEESSPAQLEESASVRADAAGAALLLVLAGSAHVACWQSIARVMRSLLLAARPTRQFHTAAKLKRS